MRDILNIGKSGMQSFQEKTDILSNNIANVNTEGYKRINKSFIELVRTEAGHLGTPLSEDLNSEKRIMSSGAKTSSEYRDFQQGALIQTNDRLQLAIDGMGYFGVEDSNNQTLLTRNIRVSISGNGNLVDQNGLKIIMTEQRNLSRYSNEDLEVSESGGIFIKEGGAKVGQLTLFKPENEQRLLSVGKGYYGNPDSMAITQSTGRERSFGNIRQGYKENSNVDLGEEIVELIITQRAYQMNSKSIEAADDMWKTANNLRG
ncbi:MAG: flagellar hook-basal body complex protein [Peptostreptococcales bacterium]